MRLTTRSGCPRRSAPARQRRSPLAETAACHWIGQRHSMDTLEPHLICPKNGLDNGEYLRLHGITSQDRLRNFRGCQLGRFQCVSLIFQVCFVITRRKNTECTRVLCSPILPTGVADHGVLKNRECSPLRTVAIQCGRSREYLRAAEI